MPKKALFILTNHAELGTTGKKTGWYLPEVTHVYFPLKDAGFEIDFASPRGGHAPMDPGSESKDDVLNIRFLTEEKGALSKIERTLAPGDVDPKNYDVLYFAGGHGTMWDFPSNEALQKLTASVYEKGGIVAAVCHGPAALVDVRLSTGLPLVAGKEVSAFTNAEEDEVGLSNVVPFQLQTRLTERGALFKDGGNWKDSVVVSGRLVTGQNPQSAASLGKAIVALSVKPQS